MCLSKPSSFNSRPVLSRDLGAQKTPRRVRKDQAYAAARAINTGAVSAQLRVNKVNAGGYDIRA